MAASNQNGSDVLQSVPSSATLSASVVEAPATTTAIRAPISALDQAMAATLAAITVPSPQNGKCLTSKLLFFQMRGRLSCFSTCR